MMILEWYSKMIWVILSLITTIHCINTIDHNNYNSNNVFNIINASNSSNSTITIFIDGTSDYLNQNNDCGLIESSTSTYCRSINDAINTYQQITPLPSSLQLFMNGGVYGATNNSQINLYGYNIEIVGNSSSSSPVIIDFSNNNTNSSSSNNDMNETTPIISSTSFIIINNLQQSPIIISNLAINNVTNIAINNIQLVNINTSYGGLLNVQSNDLSIQLTLDTVQIVNGTSVMGTAIYWNQPTSPAPINNTVSTITINNSQFNNNTAQQCGGVIYILVPTNWYTLLTITNSLFTNNMAINGSVIYGNTLNNVSISTSQFHYNIGLDSYKTYKYLYRGGGTIFMFNTPMTITQSLFQNNIHQNGGVILYQDTLSNSMDMLYINSCNFTNNVASVSGGAIAVIGTYIPSVIMDNNIYISNRANVSGGSVYIETTDQFIISNSLFLEDSSPWGASCTFNVTYGMVYNVSILFNYSPTIQMGGGIYAYGSNIMVNESVFAHLYAVKGATIYCDKSVLELVQSQFINNTDKARTKNQVDNIFCSMAQCTISHDQAPPRTCRDIPIITPKTIPPGVIIAIVVGCVLSGLLFFLLIVMFLRRKKGSTYQLLQSSTASSIVNK